MSTFDTTYLYEQVLCKTCHRSQHWTSFCEQRFSNYGPRTTCGPRGLPLWSFKKDRRKNIIQINFVSLYRRNSQIFEITHDNCLSLFLPVLTFMKLITLPTYRIPTELSEAKERFKALWTRCFLPYFPCTSDTVPEFITEDQSIQPLHVFMTFLMVLPTSSLHLLYVIHK